MALKLPGERLATTEEWFPANGVFVEDGIIYASRVGNTCVDKARRLSIHSQKELRLPSTGDVAIVRIEAIYRTIAAAKIIAYEKPGVVTTSAQLFIPLSQAGGARTLREAFRIGDVVRCTVIDLTTLGIYMSIARHDLGVVIAYCSRCRSELKRERGLLICKRCGNFERRKLAAVKLYKNLGI